MIRDLVQLPVVILASLCLVAGVAECGSIKVKATHDPAAKFGEYKTFAIVPSNSIEEATVREVVERLIARELTGKGLTEVEEAADLLVTYDAAVGSKEQIATSLGYAVETYNGVTTVYTVGRGVPWGAVVVALVDRSRGTVVWQAAGKGALKQGMAADARLERLQDAIVRILASYPPKG